MESIKNLLSLPDYCKKFEWPRKPQWFHWVYSRHPIAKACVKKLGNRYMIDLEAFEKYVKNATLDDDCA